MSESLIGTANLSLVTPGDVVKWMAQGESLSISASGSNSATMTVDTSASAYLIQYFCKYSGHGTPDSGWNGIFFMPKISSSITGISINGGYIRISTDGTLTLTSGGTLYSTSIIVTPIYE